LKQQEKETSLKVLFIFEIIVQTVIICYAYISVGMAILGWFWSKNPPVDFIIYYLAGQGNYVKEYIYTKWISFIFIPFTWADHFDAYLYWTGILTVCFMILVHKMFQVKYGWVLALVVLYSFASLLMVGNIQILLLLICCFPLPSLLGILVKPHYFIYSVLHYLAAYFRTIKHLPLKKQLTSWQGFRSCFSWQTIILYKNFNWYWLGIILICLLCSIPSKESWEFALTQGKVLTRPDNIILLLPAYYILMKKQESS
jgi:hypothetical protein